MKLVFQTPTTFPELFKAFMGKYPVRLENNPDILPPEKL